MLTKAAMTIFLMLSSTFSFAQEKILSNLEFTNKVISDAVGAEITEAELPKNESYFILNTTDDHLSSYISEKLLSLLIQKGFRASLISKNIKQSEGVMVRVLNPALELNIKDAVRKVTGNFEILFYSESDGNFNWGKEYNVSMNHEDSIEGANFSQLDRGSPEFLKSNKQSIYSGRRWEKVLTGLFVGVITYLFYSVRS